MRSIEDIKKVLTIKRERDLLQIMVELTVVLVVVLRMGRELQYVQFVQCVRVSVCPW